MDYYNSKFPLIFAPKNEKNWAITLGQHTWYSVSKDKVTPDWIKHEDCHKAQWKREGYLKFSIRYLYQLVTKGYLNIDYEIEAREASMK